MHWLFSHKILFSSTCSEPQVLIFRRIQLYTCSIWYCQSLWEFLVACLYTAWVSLLSSLHDPIVSFRRASPNVVPVCRRMKFHLHDPIFVSFRRRSPNVVPVSRRMEFHLHDPILVSFRRPIPNVVPVSRRMESHFSDKF